MTIGAEHGPACVRVEAFRSRVLTPADPRRPRVWPAGREPGPTVRVYGAEGKSA